MKLTFVGDVHGNDEGQLDLYRDLTSKTSYTFQVGDVSFGEYGEMPDPKRHVFIGGNHDNYTMTFLEKEECYPELLKGIKYTEYHPTYMLHKFQETDGRHLKEGIYWYNKLPENCLNNFGTHRFNEKHKPIFYMRGARSPDGDNKKRFMSEGHWFPREQISLYEATKALKIYQLVRPDIIVTHDAPMCVGKQIIPNKDRTFTNIILQNMFNYHKPKLWVFGHYHKSWEKNISGTDFVCLDILGRNGDTKIIDL